MPLVAPDVGELKMLDYLRLNWGTLDMALFTADHVPGPADTLATYLAMEATFPGYARVQLLNWTLPASDGSGRGRTLADLVTFTRTGGGAPNLVWGYFVVDSSPQIMWAERHPSPPVQMLAIGDVFRVNPALTLRSEV